jgi:hypothetical protein
MRVALFKVSGDGSGGWIEVYEVEEESFERILYEISPGCDEDWWAVAREVERIGKLVYRIEPDYSIWLEL